MIQHPLEDLFFIDTEALADLLNDALVQAFRCRLSIMNCNNPGVEAWTATPVFPYRI
jgi:hypothetical protein